MGARVAEVLRGRGVRVVTTLDGRSRQTARRCQEGGIAARRTLDEVVAESGVVLSLVTTGAAEGVAAQYAARAHLAPPDAIFVDVNSVGPELVAQIAGRIEAAGRSFVDGAINGLAKNLTTTGTLFLSGARAGEVAALFDGAVRVRVLGNDAGAASCIKMLLAGFAKGVCALHAELALSARRHGMLEAMTAATTEIYPEIARLVDRMLPTYARHAGRRATEMGELEKTVANAGVEPLVTAAVRELHERLARVRWGDQDAAVDAAAVIEMLSAASGAAERSWV
jgi:3-hydroxyisobutyrate dehydrogenase-like beta-hydroxyacid dehydrogenase